MAGRSNREAASEALKRVVTSAVKKEKKHTRTLAGGHHRDRIGMSTCDLKIRL